MKIVSIDKVKNEAVVNYNGTDTLVAKIRGFYYINNNPVIDVKLPNWCCNGNAMTIDYDYEKEIRADERKKVCDEVRCKLMENEYAELRNYQGIKYAWFNLPAFSEVLDRIEKGSDSDRN